MQSTSDFIQQMLKGRIQTGAIEKTFTHPLLVRREGLSPSLQIHILTSTDNSVTSLQYVVLGHHFQWWDCH